MKNFIKKIVNRAMCFFRGHQYRTLAFRSNALYFCSCCGEEVTGRTFADLVPMSADEHEELMREFQ